MNQNRCLTQIARISPMNADEIPLSNLRQPAQSA